ncbi:DUF6194 family protein [Micromonospora musae]|uniref:DUF6194 family protein n=1 Tax=Micromonospora musae TaxID=1894970 RepID=UPI001F3741D9|nr:DUF6194 family protein [Micromonospora musae]
MAAEPHSSETDGITADEITARILALPDVELLVATDESGAPEVAWGWRFFYVGPDRRRPFATIGERDMAGFDEESRLDRPGVFRLNLELGRREFHRLFGYPPAEADERRASVDVSTLDEVLPHPVYGTAAWGCVLNPGPRSLAEVERLIGYAHGRAHERHHHRTAHTP